MSMRPCSLGTRPTSRTCLRRPKAYPIRSGAVAGVSRSAPAVRQTGHRLERAAVDPHLEVQVEAGRGAGLADPADHLPPADPLPDPHSDARLVAVAGGDAPIVVLAGAGVQAVGYARVVAV